MLLPSDKRERPSRHGAILGEVLAALATAGRRDAPALPDMCATCAFREGCMTNQMAGTGIVALNCVLGIDKDRFACHHGMKDGDPSRLCAGYIAAKLAPFPLVKKALLWLGEQMTALSGPDDIRTAFDAWAAEVDPDNAMDDYQRGRAYLRASRASETPKPIFAGSEANTGKTGGRDAPGITSESSVLTALQDKGGGS